MKQKVTQLLVLFCFLLTGLTNQLVAQNLALSATATASTGVASLANDGDAGSRWESESSDPQWILFSL